MAEWVKKEAIEPDKSAGWKYRYSLVDDEGWRYSVTFGQDGKLNLSVVESTTRQLSIYVSHYHADIAPRFVSNDLKANNMLPDGKAHISMLYPLEASIFSVDGIEEADMAILVETFHHHFQ